MARIPLSAQIEKLIQDGMELEHPKSVSPQSLPSCACPELSGNVKNKNVYVHFSEPQKYKNNTKWWLSENWFSNMVWIGYQIRKTVRLALIHLLWEDWLSSEYPLYLICYLWLICRGWLSTSYYKTNRIVSRMPSVWWKPMEIRNTSRRSTSLSAGTSFTKTRSAAVKVWAQWGTCMHTARTS